VRRVAWCSQRQAAVAPAADLAPWIPVLLRKNHKKTRDFKEITAATHFLDPTDVFLLARLCEKSRFRDPSAAGRSSGRGDVNHLASRR